MKKILLSLLAITFFANILTAQVFNTGQTIKTGEVAFGVSPTYYNSNSGTLALFLHAGYGISDDLDFGFRFGFFDGVNYIGGDIEKNFYHQNNLAISLTAGVHGWKDVGVGVDVTGNLTLQIEQFEVYSGLDVDVDFMKTLDGRDSRTNIWIPIGFNANIMDDLELILEANIALSENVNSIFCGGLVYYFNR